MSIHSTAIVAAAPEAACPQRASRGPGTVYVHLVTKAVASLGFLAFCAAAVLGSTVL